MASDRLQIPANELIRLNGKGALVTGGASGIGYAISWRLAEAGARTVIADIDAVAAKAAVKRFAGDGLEVSAVSGDVSAEGDVAAMFQGAGDVDILVNNAGIFPYQPFGEITSADFDRVQAVNVRGVFLCCQEFVRRQRARRAPGVIINIASIDGLHSSATGLLPYDTSKGAVVMLTRSLALELGRDGIRVNAIAPGGIVTEGVTAGVTGDLSDARKEFKRFMARMPLGAMGRPDDVACTALFLATEMSAYTTGSLVVVDGGYLVA